jgi:hypothetical protein
VRQHAGSAERQGGERVVAGGQLCVRANRRNTARWLARGAARFAANAHTSAQLEKVAQKSSTQPYAFQKGFSSPTQAWSSAWHSHDTRQEGQQPCGTGATSAAHVGMSIVEQALKSVVVHTRHDAQHPVNVGFTSWPQTSTAGHAWRSASEQTVHEWQHVCSTEGVAGGVHLGGGLAASHD